MRYPLDRYLSNESTYPPLEQLGLVDRKPISANPGLNLNLVFFFLFSKAFFRIIFSILFRASNHPTVDEKN